MLWFIPFFFFKPCFSETMPFFSEIGKRPEKFQKKILERRLQFILERGMNMETEHTTRTYLELKYGDNEKKMDFIVSLLNRAGEEKKALDIKRKILSSAVQSCKTTQCVLLLKSLPKIKNPEIIDKNLRTEILNRKLLHHRYYSPSVARSSFLTELFDKLINDDKKNLKKILSRSFQYGMYGYVDKKITQHRKEFGNKYWLKYKECYSFIVKNQYQKAKACSEHRQGAWLNFVYLYSIFLQGGKITNKDIEELGSMFEEDEDDKVWSVVVKLLFLKNGTKEMFSGFDMNEIVEIYGLGHWFFAVNSRYHMFKGEELEKLMKIYSEKFKGSMFEQVLNGQVNRKKLIEYFGKNSPNYRFYKDP